MKKRIMDKINKPTLPATILIASLILGSFFYASQVNKQRSIERQQEIKLQDDKRAYVAKRKNECYSLYEKERDKWNNVADFSYNETRDVCIVRYKSSEPVKSKEECEKIIENMPTSFSDELRDGLFERWRDCLENWFSKEF